MKDATLTTDIELRTTEQGVTIAVQGQPGARRNGIAGVHDGRLKIAVTQVAEKGKANKEILTVLADALGIAKSQLQVIQGQTTPRKTILVQDVSAEEIRGRLLRCLPKS